MVNNIFIASLLLPLIGALLFKIADKHENIRDSIVIFISICLFGLICLLYQSIDFPNSLKLTLFELLPGLALAFHVEPLGMIFSLLASFLWVITSIYSIGYMRSHNEENQTRFYICFAIAISSVMGICFSANMLTLFLFYEVLTISTYPLVTHSQTEEAKRSGRVYLAYLLGTSIVLQLLAIIWTWNIAGTLDFTAGGILSGKASETVITILLVLYVLGIGKAGLMPFHRWLPAAMVAPTPVSALLHAVAVVKAGVFTILKISIYLFGIDLLSLTDSAEWLMYLAGFTIICASVIAIYQDNLKKRLAYSTISQLSYIILATMLANKAGIIGAGMHIVMHAFGKITLFFCAGAIMVASHKTKVSELNGIGKAMPWTMGAFAIASLSMIGVPPTAGFLSKWYILQGAFAVESWFAISIIIMSTLLNAGYFLPIIYAAFFKKPVSGIEYTYHEAPWPILIALTVTVLLTITLFLFPAIPLQLVNGLVGGML